MRYTLLESGARSERRTAGTMVSVLLHSGAIALAIVGTARATPRPAHEPAPTSLVYAAPPREVQPVIANGHAGSGFSAPDPTRFAPPVIPPVSIESRLPGIDLTHTLDRGHMFDGAASATAALGGNGSGDALSGPADGVWSQSRVDKAVVARAGNPTPRYPEALRAARVEGVVVARFVVDSSGRVEPASIRFVESTHPQFDDAVRAALLTSRYYPAEVGGRRVRQLVEQRFAFRLAP